MHCATCGKDSTNRRVCPYCFTPYPDAEEPRTGATRRPSAAVQRPSAAGPRHTTGSTAAVPKPAPPGGIGAWVMRQTPLVRFSGAGILLVLLLWAFTGAPDEAPSTRRGEPVPVDTSPMTPEEARALIATTRERALVETQADEVYVSYSAGAFPVDQEGQLALVRRFARADEVLEGRRRRIFFYGPNGRMFAQSDAVTGLTLVR